MGYYTDVELDLNVLCSDEEFNRRWEGELEKDKELFDWYGDVKSVVRRVVFKQDYTRKFYEYRRFAAALAPVVKGMIVCRGEDGELWRLVFDGEGHWDEQRGMVIYDSLFGAFMEEFGDKMPKELHEAILEWDKKRKILEAV